jgi:hypothetical protein
MASEGYQGMFDELPPDTLHADPETMEGSSRASRERSAMADYAREIGVADADVERLRAQDGRALTRTVLLTGATGFVGKVVLEELLRRREELGVERVLALVRARDPQHAAARCAPTSSRRRASPRTARLGGSARAARRRRDAGRPRLRAARARALGAEVTHVIHCAASVEFTLPLAEALAVNTRGALHALDVARTCTRARVVRRRLDRLRHAASRSVRTRRPSRRGGARPLPRDPEALFDLAVHRGGGRARLLAETGIPTPTRSRSASPST